MRPSACSLATTQALDLAELYRTHRAFVRSSLLQCGVPSVTLDDAIHDVFMVVARRLSDYDADRGSMRAWLFGISLRIARAHRRALGRTCTIPDELSADAVLTDPERYVSHLRAAEAADRILETLPRDQWSVLMMADVEGMTAPEIASTLGVKLNTVYTRLMRARTKVRRQAEENGSRRWLAAISAGLGKFFRPTPLLATAAFVSMRTLRGVLVVAAAAAAIAAVVMLGSSKADDAADNEIVGAAAGNGGGVGIAKGKRAHSSSAPMIEERTASISGTVSGDNGAPIAAATVCVWREVDALPISGRPEPRCTRTAANGHYRIERLLPGPRYRVTATAAEHAPVQYVGSDGKPQLRLVPKEVRKGVDLRASGGGVLLRGTIVDIIGGPIDKATVALVDTHPGDGWSSRWGAGAPAMARTDAEGNFAAWVARGSVEIAAFASGYAPAKLVTTAPGPTSTLALAPESVISGVVVGPTKTPVAGAEVKIDGWDDRGLGAVRSDADGRFRLAGLGPGRYRIVATAHGRTGRSASSLLLGIGEAVDGVEIELREAATLVARVTVEETGEPCPRGIVAIETDPDTSVASIDSEGFARFDAVLPATYSVMLACEGFADKEYPQIEVGADPVEVEFEVSAGATLSGRVVDEAGGALSGAWVIAYGTSKGASPVPHRVPSGEDGTYTVTGLAAGTYNVEAQTATDASSGQQVAEVGKDGKDGFELKIERGGVIKGSVVDGGGTAVVNARVIVASRGRVVRTADDGTFHIGELPAGEATLMVRRDDDDRAPPTKVDVEAGATTEVEISMPERDGTITGILLDEDGSPVADAVVVSGLEGKGPTQGAGPVLAALRASSSWWRGRPSVLTDGDGRFTLESLPDGKHTVLAFRRGGGDAWEGGVSLGASVKLELPHPTNLEGTVHTADGKAPKMMRVEVRGVDNGLRLGENFSLAGGKWRFEELVPGTYEVRVKSPDGLAKATVELAPEATKSIAMTLKLGLRIDGMFVDLDTGEPVADVFAISGPGDITIGELARNAERAVVLKKNELRSDGKGHFVIPDARPGSLRIIALAAALQTSEHAVVKLTAELKEGTTTLQPIALPRRRVENGEKTGELGFKLAEQDSPFCTGTPAVGEAGAGLKEGDEIVEIAGHDVREKRCYLAQTLLTVPPKTRVKLKLADDRTLTVTAR